MRSIVQSISFRDPDGYIFESGPRLLRYVRPEAAEDLQAILASAPGQNWIDSGKLVRSRPLPNPSRAELPAECAGVLPSGAMIVEHEPLPFRNYPYEWTPGMLHAAAALTLELAREAMHNGYALKDATPYNVMFDGCRPVFLDLLSFRRRDPRESIWQAYGQFVRTFALPLLAHRHFNLQPGEILLAHRDGLEPEKLLSLCPALRRLLPPFLFSVTLPVLLSRTERKGPDDRYRVHHARDEQEATFLLEKLLARAQRLLGAPPAPRSGTADLQYMDSGLPYDPREFAAKEQFVAAALQRWAPHAVLDIGCNTGHFSRLAARCGARVVAIDRDPDVVDTLWRSAEPGVLPMAVDIGRPPGGCGWHNRECRSFLDRASGAFDCVFMLALLHHLLVNERLPMDSILELVAELTTQWAVIEYVDRDDANFRRLARGRDELHRGVTRENFERAAEGRFEIAGAADLNLTRRIYLLRKKEN